MEEKEFIKQFQNPHRKLVLYFSVGIGIALLTMTGIFFAYSHRQVVYTADDLSREVKKIQAEKVLNPTTSTVENKDPEKIDEVKKLSLLATGDIMLDRNVLYNVQKAGNNYNFPFALIEPYMQQADLRIGNLEGPVTTFTSVAQESRFTFTFSTKYLDSIKRNFDIVNLGNNHTNNFGAKGLLQARKFLSDAGLSYFGDPLNSPDYLSTTTEKNGIKIGFVSYMQLANTGFDVVLDEIKRLRPSVDMLIALPHWGIEYETEKPWARQQEEAYAMIDAGVDTIIGTHPHVIQPIEQYNGKTIFYSLGNFIFDQYFSEETMQGLTVRMNIEKDTTSSTVSYILQPVVISKRSQVSVAPGDVTKTILDHLSQVSIVSSTVQEEIARGSFK